MKKNKNEIPANKAINIENLVQQIMQDIYDQAHHATVCNSCNSKKISLVDEQNLIYKCQDCKISFSPKTNSLFQKVRFSDDKWIKFLTCMINDESLEQTVRCVQSNAESVKRRWTLIYETVDWKQYNLLVRDKPIKNIYADFEVIIG